MRWFSNSPDESVSSSDSAAPPSPLPTAAPEEVEYVKQAPRKSKVRAKTKRGTDEVPGEVERRRVSARGKARVRQKRDVLTVSGRAETSDSSMGMSEVTDSVGKKSGWASSNNASPLKTSRPSTPKGRAEKDNWALILRAKDRVRKLMREKQAEEAKRGKKLPARDNGDTDSPAHVREVLDELGDEETARLYHVKIEMGKEKYERDQKLFTVIATGARPGEILRGIRDKTRDAVVRVNTLIRPSARRLLTIHHSASAWALFLKKLGQVAFFHPLSLDERSDWLVQHAITEDYDLADVPGLTLDFSSLGSGSSAFLTRSEPQMELVLTKSESGEGISPVEVLGMFQNKPGSKGLRGRPTLVFLRQYWKVESTHIEVEAFSGVCVSVTDGRVLQGAQISPMQKSDPKRSAKNRVEHMSTTSNSDSQSHSVTQNGAEGRRLGIRTPDMNVCEDVMKATQNGPGQSPQIKDASGDTILLFSGFERDEGATHPTANKRFKADIKPTTKASKKKKGQKKSADEAAAEMSGSESAAGDNSDDPIPDATTQQTVGFIVSKRNLPLSQSEALEAADVTEEDFLRIKPSLRGFTAAGYKSLLQKIIRARPSQVELLDGQRLDSGLVLRTTVMLLFLHAGAFVPDIQRYVTGAESALKRVAVCVLEDSYTPDHQSLLSLLAAAWVAQASARLWRPGKVQLSQAVAVAMQAWQNEDKFKWSHISESDNNIRKPSNKRTLREYVLSNSNTALENCSAMLDRLRSFQGDLLMAREIAVNKGLRRVCRGTSTGSNHGLKAAVFHMLHRTLSSGVLCRASVCLLLHSNSGVVLGLSVVLGLIVVLGLSEGLSVVLGLSVV
ncbi:hypothetical protein SARC_00535 [Sphaeroforma arctica JP610]|uniref:Uncharacterized protein n=1 Tax=Sphaeroforma arctica JP610 TaxID=667725 RepID=A0A0L0GEA1_9EUKA|nr:hypothetical protein SARC_00535 [Sphaeroforma arctica JP610]KNC87345.1 hypothetical protein SARC_00535 [Sphaeroforma arctica JP610]|eukprot:XP_014161247.1 hypothetical protein SARC_00535 [Sphaeroforma arctica JP610]